VTSTRLVATALAALVAAPHLAGAQQKRPDTVSLRFGWPAGMTAGVRQDWTRVQSRGERRDSTYIATSYRLRVAAHPKGRLVRADSFRVLSPAGAAPNGAEQVLARIGSFAPSYVVSAKGEFVGIERLAEMKATLDSLFAPMMAELRDAPPQLKQLMTAATSAEALNASAAQEWNVLAGTWVGADWEVGEAYAAEAEEPIPLFAGMKVRMAYVFSAAERLACPGAAAAAPRPCGRLEMRCEPHSAALRQMVENLMTKVAPDMREQVAMLAQMRAENRVSLIADPRDLRPYRLELEKRIDVTSNGTASEPAETMTRVDRRVVQYTHAP
jgi:hypothetical protein